MTIEATEDTKTLIEEASATHPGSQVVKQAVLHIENDGWRQRVLLANTTQDGSLYLFFAEVYEHTSQQIQLPPDAVAQLRALLQVDMPTAQIGPVQISSGGVGGAANAAEPTLAEEAPVATPEHEIESDGGSSPDAAGHEAGQTPAASAPESSDAEPAEPVTEPVTAEETTPGSETGDTPATDTPEAHAVTDSATTETQ
jgi:septal ring-binding cell division protein DamX